MTFRRRVFGARTAIHWRIPLAVVTLTLGSLGAVLGSAGAAGPATTAAHPDTTNTRPGGAVGGFQPGGLIKAHGSGGAGSAVARSVKNGATSTNWSGYVLTGGTGAFTSVSSSWTSFGAQDPTSITMAGSSGDQLDSTSAIDGSGDFSNTWDASS